MGAHSKRKGKSGELEVAAFLRTYGFEARRGQQFSGGGDSPDVVHDMPGWHVEVKRTARQTNLTDAMNQAMQDKKTSEWPVVMHRCDRGIWMATVKLEDFLRLVQEVSARVSNHPVLPAARETPADVQVLRRSSCGPTRS